LNFQDEYPSIALAVPALKKPGTLTLVEWVQEMKQLTTVRWKRLSISAAVGIILVLAATTALEQWKRRDGWCIRIYPDGSQQILYGADCNLPKSGDF
jgi:hypothetical protein